LSDNIQDQIAALKEQVAQLEKRAAEEAANKENPQLGLGVSTDNLNDDVKMQPKEGGPLLKWVIGGGTVFIVLLFFVSIANKTNKIAPIGVTATNASVNAVDATDAVAKAAGEATKVAQDATNAVASDGAGNVENVESKWDYQTYDDGMTDKPAKIACVESDDMISQSFPYEATHTELCIRKRPKEGLDAYFRLKSDGQILCQSYAEPCVIKVRFDSGAVQSFSGLSASDNSSDIVFFQNAERMLNSILKSKQTRVQVELYQNGSQATTFNTSGLVWPPK
jgi:hypothetical protein